MFALLTTAVSHSEVLLRADAGVFYSQGGERLVLIQAEGANFRSLATINVVHAAVFTPKIYYLLL